MTYPQEPEPENGPARAKLRGWIKVVLFTSLAINLAVAGLALGAALRHDGMAERQHTRGSSIGGPYTAALTREDRRAIWQEMRALKGDGRPSRAEVQAEFDFVVAALRAEPYDPAEVRSIIERQFQAGMARQELGQRLLLDRIDTMSPAERAGFADRLAERLENWREARSGERAAKPEPASE
ncbi:MAG: periplasmic heavy metal sensor [Rhodobacterales bacterium]